MSGQYGLKKQAYGNDRQNRLKETSIGATIALYLFDLTALELNYNESETVTTEYNNVDIDSTFTLLNQKNRVFVYSYGVGLRQLLAPKKSRFRPSISLGYARQFLKNNTVATFRNQSTLQDFSSTSATSKSRDDSVFGTFALDFRLTQAFGLRGSVNTIFKAFELDRANDNIKYMFGFSWFL